MPRPLDTREIYTITLDCYGTLIDWKSGVRQSASQIESLKRCDLERLVRDRERIEIELQRGPYRPYGELLSRSLVEAAREQECSVSDAEAARFAQSIGDWPPFDECPVVLQRLSERFQLAILSNIETAVLQASVRHLGVSFEALITAEQLVSYKPRPAHFLAAQQQLGVAKERILHVACSLYHDIRPALELGLRTAWINRKHERRPETLEP